MEHLSMSRTEKVIHRQKQSGFFWPTLYIYMIDVAEYKFTESSLNLLKFGITGLKRFALFSCGNQAEL